MKRLLLLNAFLLCSFIGFAQITDENGVSSIGVLNQQLSGKIGVGTSSPNSELDVNGTLFVSKKLPNGLMFNNHSERNEQCKIVGFGKNLQPNSHLFLNE